MSKNINSAPMHQPDDHEYDHTHNRSHGHSHNHSHQVTGKKNLVTVLCITASIFLLEIIGAYLSGSLSLLADALHVLVDSSGLVVALIAAHLMSKPRTDRLTWGFLRTEALAAAAQAGMLFVLCVAIFIEGIKRLITPEQIEARYMLWFAAIGLLGNFLSMLTLFGQRKHNLNLKAAFLEVAADAIGALMVLIAAVVATLTNWNRADAIASLLIALIMAPRALGLLGESSRVLLEEVPENLDLQEIREHILSRQHVVDCHDLHASTITTGLVALTAHVTVDDECLKNGEAIHILHDLQECVAHHFPVSVKHSTFQIDSLAHRDHEKLMHRN